MDIRCKNCGQMIDENDKYCKYCGYLIPQKEEEKLSKRQLDDKIQEEKATVSEQDFAEAKVWDIAKIKLKNEGDKKALYSRNVLLTIVALFVAVVSFVGAFVVKVFVTNATAGFIGLLLLMLVAICAFGITAERYFNTKSLKNIEENCLTVRKYGFKKPAEFLFEGYVFEAVVEDVCPECEGEIIGDLHIEIIEKKPVVICNINRKHFWVIDEKELFENVKAGKIEFIAKRK